MPSRDATSGATAGQSRSGEVVATTTVSTPLTPADRSARAPASTARVPVDRPSETTLRSLIPVRVLIHSSFVSSVAERSSFVTTLGGRKPPIPESTTAM